jgi:hypothetical protein
MAREIAEKSAVVATSAETEQGTVFIKNHLNEIIHLPNGDTYKFAKTRELITDPELASQLKKVADKYKIIVA